MAKLTMRMVRASLRDVGVTIRNDREWGEYVVRIAGSPDGHGYHTSDLADAYQTGHAMASQQRAFAAQRAALLAKGVSSEKIDRFHNTKPSDLIERAKREDEAMLGLPRGSIKG